jgi:hypothetical protein
MDESILHTSKKLRWPVTDVLQSRFNKLISDCVCSAWFKRVDKSLLTVNRRVTKSFQQANIRLCLQCLIQTCWQVVTRCQQTCYKLFQRLLTFLLNHPVKFKQLPCDSVFVLIIDVGGGWWGLKNGQLKPTVKRVWHIYAETIRTHTKWYYLILKECQYSFRPAHL